MYYESDPGVALVTLILTLVFYIGLPTLFGLGGWNMAKSRGRHQWGWAIARRSSVIAPSEKPTASTGLSGSAPTIRSVRSP